MVAPTVIELGSVTLTRVLYVDAAVPPEVVGLSATELAGLVGGATAPTWCDQRWAADGQVRVAAAAWVASVGDEHIVIDPFGNADDILHDPEHAASHQAAIAAAFQASGIPMETIARVVVSHIEGIAMNAVRRDGRWSPFFPNARIAVGDSALATLTNAPDHWTVDAWRQLIDDGAVDTFAAGETLLPGVVAQHTGAHNAGHHVFHFGEGSDGAPLASTVGHLAISPLHLVTGPCAAQHPDPELAWQQLCSLAADGRILLGPLWPSPGAGRWIDGQFVEVGGPSS
jgi:hypothetical protein